MRYITVKDLSFYYDREPVLEGVNYYLDSGEFVTLTGENGAAKSTLIKASLGILKPKVGTVEIAKENVAGKKLRIAYLPQQIASFNAGFPSSVYEFVKSGRYPRKGWFRRLNHHDEEHILASLSAVGMLEALKDEKDARIVLYRLTDLGRPVAEEHSHHHDHTLAVYNQVLSEFSQEEQMVISKFLSRLLEDLR